MIYLDHNATTPLDAEVRDAMILSLHVFGNPSSGHSIGAEAKALVDNARQQAARLIRCAPEEIVFTSGGTEADNLAIIGTALRHSGGHIITSAIEHPAVLNPVLWLLHRGYEVTVLPVDPSGMVSPDDVGKAVRKDTILITVMHSNNETGVLQPVGEIGKIAREHGIPFHTDAAQSAGKIAVDVNDLRVDMLTLVPHKFYGPKGIGALYVRSGLPLTPVLFGAGQERGLRPGTENITGIAGLGKACETAAYHMTARFEHTRFLRDMLHSLLGASLDIRLNGHETLRLPNTLNISLQGARAADIVSQLQDEVAFSAGSACHAGVTTPSAVLKSMGLSDEDALSAVRLSTGKDNTAEEIKSAAEAIIRCVKR
jgi:cysteine desulfurase